MKKNLVLLTGIVFVLTILLAGGCKFGEKKEGTEPAEDSLEPVEDVKAFADDDPTKVDIYLRDTLYLDGTVHLEMYDSKKPYDVVVDSLETEVNPGDTVIFKKAHKSNVNKVLSVSPVEMEYVNIFSKSDNQDTGLYVIIINPLSPDSIKVKYDIYFKVKKDTSTHFIDPFLKIPPQ